MKGNKINPLDHIESTQECACKHVERRIYYHIKMIAIQEAEGTQRFCYFFSLTVSVLPLTMNKLAMSPQGSCLILLCFYRVLNKGIAILLSFHFRLLNCIFNERENDNC